MTTKKASLYLLMWKKIPDSFDTKTPWEAVLNKHYSIPLNKADIRKIKVAEMWSMGRMEKVKWVEKMANEEILKNTIQKSSIMSNISNR